VGDADSRLWETVAQEYAFVDELAALRPQISGAGSRERFDYWLGQFHYLKAMGKLRCSRHEFNQAVDRIEKATEASQPAAIEAAIQARRQLVADWGTMMTHLLETVSTPGEMGTIANLELHTRLAAGYLTTCDALLEKKLGKPLPAGCAVPSDYAGKPRLVVPTVRTIVTRGETLKLKIMVLDKQPATSVTVHIRPLGQGAWQTIPAAHLARAVYEATFPAVPDDFEYYVSAETSGGRKLVWPVTAPQRNQTVVLADIR
jgi:hypothetical protein